MSNFFEQNPFGPNQNQVVMDLQNNLAQKNQMISQFLQRVEAMELASKKPSTKKDASKATPPTKKSPKTPLNQCERSATPATPASGSKKNPLQMVTSEQPEGFESTKEAFYLHIKILWGLIESGTIPSLPKPNQSVEFNQQFSCAKKIKHVINSRGSPHLVAFNQIENLREAKSTRKKLAKNFYHMLDMLIQYIHTLLARIGICKWAPDLEAQPNSLYNKAC
ncbi:hypothetical protein PCASD_00220 [Puccinia coronata f. sp. avenae]|uniref:Uncharacterized protein n=1 Tax=Puccinia coronata f. sp. avenae TaxID=200324 RepID=A0A2N5VQG5_9BASI|nr:hypothetical protein PCASD_00220 [Puccinia coronata f. sp. avenae]